MEKVVIKEKPEGQNKNQEYGYCADNVFIAIWVEEVIDSDKLQQNLQIIWATLPWNITATIARNNCHK